MGLVAVGSTPPIPVLLQRSLTYSDSARVSQTIIHSALNKDLNEKLPDPSTIYQGGPMPVLKLEKDDEHREFEFKFYYLKSLTTRERFLLMQKKSDEMKKILRTRGYRKSFEIIKRS